MASEKEGMTLEEALENCRCPYRQDLRLICLEDNCGKEGACDCPIWLRYSGQLAYALNQKD